MRVAMITTLMLGTVTALTAAHQLDKKPQTPQQPKQDFSVTVARAIETANPKLSDTRKKLLTKMLTGIAQEVFTDSREQEYWVALLGVESRYDGRATSQVGAKGIGQLMPKFAADFAASCGMTEVDANDITDDYTNAYLSACYFRELIRKHDGSIALALIGYNGGLHSAGMKAAKAGGNPAVETANYVTRVMVKREQNNTERTP